jgi:hypothetical protein
MDGIPAKPYRSEHNGGPIERCCVERGFLIASMLDYGNTCPFLLNSLIAQT